MSRSAASEAAVETCVDVPAKVDAKPEMDNGAADLDTRVCSAPLGNLNRFSETCFFSVERSADASAVDVDAGVGVGVGVAAAVAVAFVDFSTLPWLSLRNGGGSHFRPLKPRLLFPGELVFAVPLPSLATLSASSGSAVATTFWVFNPVDATPVVTEAAAAAAAAAATADDDDDDEDDDEDVNPMPEDDDTGVVIPPELEEV